MIADDAAVTIVVSTNELNGPDTFVLAHDLAIGVSESLHMNLVFFKTSGIARFRRQCRKSSPANMIFFRSYKPCDVQALESDSGHLSVIVKPKF